MKTEMKHTPGPWRIYHHSSMDLRIIQDHSEETCVAAIPNWKIEHHEERYANARLIAAAPELLEAAMWLIGLKDIRPHDYEEQRPLAWNALRAAIRKATGVI